MSINEEITDRLMSLADSEYRLFQIKLTPSAAPESVIGVRTPQIRALAKEYSKREEIGEFLSSLPHKYYDENNLHGLIIAEIKDYDECIERLDAFLPYVDNWATCDIISPKVFKKHKSELFEKCREWVRGTDTYTVRFGVEMLMSFFLDSDFTPAAPALIAEIESDEYYINMIRAWYFATALAKQYEAVLPYITEHRLDTWTNNKTIQKAVESYRITDEQKDFLRTYKVK